MGEPRQGDPSNVVAGRRGGWATAKLLLGRSNPAGRLPVTWARALKDYPASNPRYPERSSRGVANKTTFSEGVDVGYRWFDRQGVEPLFPFGHGLSYTTFDDSDLKVVAASDGGLDLSVRIRNTGHVDGDEAPQVYLSAPTDRPSAVQFAVRKLVAFDRVTLTAGQANTVRFHVPLRQLQDLVFGASSVGHRLRRYTVSVEASSRDLRLEAVAARR